MNNPDAPQKDDDNVSFRLTFSLDGQFFRRECPVCGLHFKTLTNPEQLSHMLAPEIQRVYDEAYGVQENHEEAETKFITCPYCGSSSKENDTFTKEFRDYLVRWAEREIVFPSLKKFQNDLKNMFPKNKKSNSIISFSMEFKDGDLYPSIRPIAGPEPSDMRSVEILCCSNEVKILENWESHMYCPSCSQTLIIT